MSEVLTPVDPVSRIDQITWRFGAGEIRLVAGADAPVRVVSVRLADDPAPWPADLDHAVPLVELALGVEGRQGASPHAQHRRYRPSNRLRHVRHDAVHVRTGSTC